MKEGIQVLFQARVDADRVVEMLRKGDQFQCINPDKLSTRHHCVSVLKGRGELLAFAKLRVYPDEARIHIEFLEVALSHRGQGHGRMLYEKIFEQAAQMGCEKSIKALVTGDYFTAFGKETLMPLRNRIQSEQFPYVESFQISGGA